MSSCIQRVWQATGKRGRAHLPATHVHPASNRCAVGKVPLRHAGQIWALPCAKASLPVINCAQIEGALFRSDDSLWAARWRTVFAGGVRLPGPEMENQGKQRAHALTATTGAQCMCMTTRCSRRKFRSRTASSRCQPCSMAPRKAGLSTEDSVASR